MGMIRVLSVLRRTVRGAFTVDIKGDAGGGNNVTAQHASSPGDDSPPLPGDAAVTVPTPGSGRSAAVAYMDVRNAGTAAPGEKRIYGRNAGGAIVGTVHIKADGTIELENASGSLTLTAGGNVEASGDFDCDGDINCGGDINCNGDINGGGDINCDGGIIAELDIVANNAVFPISVTYHFHWPADTIPVPSTAPKGNL